jgi:hypothetical protein
LTKTEVLTRVIGMEGIERKTMALDSFVVIANR